MQQKEFKPTIKQYLVIWKQAFRMGTRKSGVYKSEMFIRIVRTIFLVVIQIILLSLVFGNQEVYVGWTKAQAYLVIGIWNLLNYSGWAFFGVNLEYLESKVLNGDFDHILLKPISPIWLASFGDFSIFNWISSLAGIVLIAYYFLVDYSTVTWQGIVMGLIGIILGFIFWYAVYLFFAGFALSNPRNGFMAVAKELLAVTKYPTDIFGSSLQIIFYTIIPIAFVSTVPANIIRGRESVYILVLGGVLCFLFLRLSIWNWYQNLKKYTSAGG